MDDFPKYDKRIKCGFCDNYKEIAFAQRCNSCEEEFEYLQRKKKAFKNALHLVHDGEKIHQIKKEG